MLLDDLKTTWAAHGALLERSLRIDERKLRDTSLGRSRRALAPYVAWLAVQLLAGVAGIATVMPILWDHLTDLRYLGIGGALVWFVILVNAQTGRLFVAALGLDWSGPVTTLQRDLEAMKVLEYRVFKWALLGGIVAWLPALLLLFEAWTGVPALEHVHGGWLLANVAFGLGVLAAGQAWSREHVERADLAPWVRRFVDGLSGHGLRAATRHLEELRAFVGEG